MADNRSSTVADRRVRWEDQICSGRRRLSYAGYLSIALLAGGFGYWATTAPIARAAVAHGVIAAAGRNVMIQHPEGGVIQRVLVREGDHVRAGQDLYILDPTAAQTNVNRLGKQIVSLKARLLRLAAERDGARELNLPSAAVLGPGLDDIDELIVEQHKEFAARLSRFVSEQEILYQRVATLDETAEGLKAQKAAIGGQLAIVRIELDRKKRLVDQGLTNVFEYTQIQRNEADLMGRAGAIDSQLSANATQTIEAREQIERIKTQRVEQAVTALNEVRAQLADAEEQFNAAKAVLSRTVIKAPSDGIIVSMTYNTVGSVIGPGEKVIEILPTSDRPIVEAKLSPQEIDAVHIGQPARLRLTALNARLTPEVGGVITDISADRLVDQTTYEVYYRARLRFADELPPGVMAEQLYPGMPVEAYIDAGERTFFGYLVRPIRDSLSRALKEE